ncbi:unnamed protein product [Lactuca saligna]|uniref:Uncharacterized protein n=1 Tax=Lactuca saligna TaxID=75948 RepID=A0AA35VMA3_LACSI|nr:unnamed protein product [Lactuca saligna]
MDRMFDEFANLWMKMKIQVKTKEELDSKQYIFRPRAFDIKDVIEMDVSTLESSIANEAFSEWKELASEEVSVESEKDFCLIPESPFYLEGQGGLFEFIQHRLKENGHVVTVLAEGADQEYVSEMGDDDPIPDVRKPAKRQSGKGWFLFNFLILLLITRLRITFSFCNICRDYDGKVTHEEMASAAIYLKDNLGKEGVQELINNLSKEKEGNILVEDIVKLGSRAEDAD